jgi:hypothetical protein
LNPRSPKDGLTLGYVEGGDKCNATQNYQLKLNLICDKGVKKDEPTFELEESVVKDDCRIKVINMRSSVACPALSLGTLWIFYN